MNTKKILITTLIISLIITSCSESKKNNNTKTLNLTQYVNTFVGTDGPGNTYPGAVLPFGMIQLSPDNGLPGWDRIAGYFWQDSTIAGFSHKHLTGTGAGDLYDILIMPYNNKFTKDLWAEQENYRPYSLFSHKQEKASPGYYSVDLLSSGIKAELTTTERVGMHRYKFPANDDSKILLDLGYKLNWDNTTDTYIKIKNDSTIIGYRFSTGWAREQKEFFVLKLSESFKNFELFNDNKVIDSKETKGTNTKLLIHFKNENEKTILIKVALSSVSIENAEQNMQQECSEWNFDKIRQLANAKWEKQLEKIIIDGTDYQKEVFYTNLYHTMLTPSVHSDINGEYKGANGKINIAKGYKKYDTFSLWDTYRATHPLFTIIETKRTEDFIKSFLSHFDETGLLPVWSLAGNETNMMIGYHSVPIIVDAFFKGIPMDTLKAYEACKKTAISDAWSLKDYKKYGYVPYDNKEKGHWSVSKTLEYAYDDDCIAKFAMALRKTDDAEYFNKRANYWKNIFDSKTGFFRPKNKKGKFIKHFIPREYTELFCESNAWHYLWNVPQNIPGLINTLGKKHFAAKLDSMFTYNGEKNDKLPIFSTGMIGQYAQGNEPSHHVAYLFNDINQPEKTQKYVRQIIDNLYTNKEDGFCGNEDCGQMSAWMIMSSLGMYPVNPANGVYYITSPWIKSANINLENGKIFKIRTENYSKDNYLVDYVMLNNKKLNNLKITHKQIMKGGELVFVMKK